VIHQGARAQARAGRSDLGGQSCALAGGTQLDALLEGIDRQGHALGCALERNALDLATVGSRGAVSLTSAASNKKKNRTSIAWTSNAGSVPRSAKAWRGQLCERLHLDKRRQPRTRGERGGHRAAVTGKNVLCRGDLRSPSTRRCATHAALAKPTVFAVTDLARQENCGHGADTSAARRRSFSTKVVRPRPSRRAPLSCCRPIAQAPIE